jgi:LacI family transcriptional regulator
VRHGERKPGKVTIFDIARAAGVSYSTVSRVATNFDRVNPETRRRVLEIMEELGYVPNLHARSLARGKSQIIGLLVHTLGSEYIGEIIRGIDEELSEVGYDLMLYTTHRQKGKEAQYVATITRGLADGLLLVVPMGREAYLDALREVNFPHVLVDEDGAPGESPSVGTTNRRGAYDAIRYLLEQGHRRIGFISDVFTLNTAIERLKGYRAALSEYGVEYDPALVQEADFVKPQTRSLTENLLALPEPPTAILTSTDPVAFSVVEILREHGLEVPKDMSVVGFDDIPHASLVYPRLTTVHEPLYEMGKTAAKVLLEQINNVDTLSRRIQLETHLVIRDSCAPPLSTKNASAAQADKQKESANGRKQSRRNRR